MKRVDFGFLVFLIVLLLVVGGYGIYVGHNYSNGQMHITVFSSEGALIEEFDGYIAHYKSIGNSVSFVYDGTRYVYENAVIQVERNK